MKKAVVATKLFESYEMNPLLILIIVNLRYERCSEITIGMKLLCEIKYR